MRFLIPVLVLAYIFFGALFMAWFIEFCHEAVGGKLGFALWVTGTAAVLFGVVTSIIYALTEFFP